MAILIVADHDNSALSDQTAKALTAAKDIGGDIDILVAGKGAQGVADAAAKLDGVRKVLLAESDSLEHQLAEPLAALIESLAGDYDVIAAPSTTTGKNVMPRVAALLDVMQISDVMAVEGADTFKRPIYAGNAIQTVQSLDPVKVLSIRTTGFDAAGTGAAAPVETVALSAVSDLSAHVEDKVVSSDRPELTSAKVVVSGGRGIGSEENFALVSSLADKLGAAVGASRAAVDSGFASNDLQVGQTGKVVAPDLYIAVGISGAIQHLAGMKDSKVIVAINKDVDAPIFQVADYGLVADLFDAVPALTEAV